MNLQGMTEYLDSLEKRGIPSVDCIVYKDHEQIYRHMNGTTDVAKTKQVAGDELYLMFSMTKVQTMVCIMQRCPLHALARSLQHLWLKKGV